MSFSINKEVARHVNAMPVFFWLGLLRGGYASQVFILKWEMFIPIKKWQAALPGGLGTPLWGAGQCVAVDPGHPDPRSAWAGQYLNSQSDLSVVHRLP